VIENPSTYLSFNQSTLPEAEFLSLLVQQTGCRLLLDVNNVYVSCFNSGSDPVKYIETLPHDAIVQMHLAGHQHCGTHIIDTHDREVTQAVWELFRLAWNRTGGVSTLLEWDGNIPSFEICLNELYKAKNYMLAEEKNNLKSEMPATGLENYSTPINFLIHPVMGQTIQMEQL
jgi:uncharacterized protein (UPF0276 family)